MSKMEIINLELARLEAEGRRVIVVTNGSWTGEVLALSALAGTGGLVTVVMDEVEVVEESKDWSDWVIEGVEGMEVRYRGEAMKELSEGVYVYAEGKTVSDAKRRKAWQTCYGPAEKSRRNNDMGYSRNKKIHKGCL